MEWGVYDTAVSAILMGFYRGSMLSCCVDGVDTGGYWGAQNLLDGYSEVWDPSYVGD